MSSTSASSASSSSGSSSDESTSASERDGAATASTSERERPSALPVASASPVAGPTPPKPKSRRKKRRARKPAPIAVNLVNCKYPLLRTVQKKLGWREVGDDDDWQLYWTDTSVAIERVMKLKPTQKINHFTGMLEICRKKQLAKNLARMAAAFPDEFTFAPETFVLPAEMDAFAEQFRSSAGGKRRRTFILKPDAGCQGKGIALCQNIDQATRALRDLGTLTEDGKPGSTSVVAQKYLTRPFLIDGYKFDLRVYALVLCADPLRVFVFNDGLARFCTERYATPKAENLRETCMHLTNYAVNKHNENFVRNTDAADTGGEGSKWSIQGLRDWMEDEELDFDKVWADVTDLVVKTIISAQPVLAHNYARVLPPESGNDGYSCFEILGLDVMLDEDLKPWLIEVNHSPSFTADSPLDLSVKEELISDAIELVRIDPRAIKRAQAEEKASSLSRLMGGARVGSKSGATAADCDSSKTRLTPEEIVERRAACVAARERWEENHSGSFDIAYPSPDFAKQKLYERLLVGARASFDEHGSHARVRDVLAQAKEKARRRVTEEEVKMLFVDRGLRVPYGEKFRRAVEAASGERDATGKVSWASVGPAVKLPLPARPGWDKNTRSDRPIIDASPIDRSIPSAFASASASAPPRPERPAPVDVPPTGSIPIAARPTPPPRASAAALTDHREETLRRLLASREAEARAAAATAAAKAGVPAPKSPGYYATLKAMLGSRPAPGVAATAPSKGGGKGIFSGIRNAGGRFGGSRGATTTTTSSTITSSTTTTNSTTKSTASAAFAASRAREREKLHAEIVGSIPVASGGFGLASQPKTSRRDGIAAESRSISAAATSAGTMGVLGAGFAPVSSRRGTRRVAN